MSNSDFGQILLNKKKELADRKADELEQEKSRNQQKQKALQTLADAVEASGFYQDAPDLSVEVDGEHFRLLVHSLPDDQLPSTTRFFDVTWSDQSGYYRELMRSSGDGIVYERVFQSHSVEEALAYMAEVILLELESTRAYLARERADEKARHDDEAFRAKATSVGWSILTITFFVVMTIAALR